MPKEEWGTKRVCPTTGKRFYDLNRNPIVSPYTGDVVTVDTGKTRTMVADTEDAETKKLKASKEPKGDDLIDDEEDEAETDDVDLGDDVLDEDDDSDDVSLDDIADMGSDDEES